MSKVKNLRNDIQVLRAIAVISVLIFHMNPLLLPGGFLGVDMFFLISGFVITKSLIKLKHKVSIFKFYLKRFFRIFPAYAVMILVTQIITSIIFLPEHFKEFIKSLKYSLFFFSNIYFQNYGDYFSPKLLEQPLLHTWSLSIEMQFYFILPIFFLYLKNLIKNKFNYKFINIILLILILGILFYYEILFKNSKDNIHFSITIRLAEFLIGANIALINLRLIKNNFLNNVLVSIGFLIIFTCIGYINKDIFSPFNAIYICIGTGIIIIFNNKNGLYKNIFNSKTLIFIGLISYSVYLWHFPFLSFYRYIYGKIDWNFLFITIYLLLTFLFAILSYFCIEKNFRLNLIFDRYLISKKIIILFFVVLSPFYLSKKLNNIVPPAPLEISTYGDDAYNCHGQVLKSCIRGGGAYKKPQILIIGDSFAAQLNPAAEIIGNNLDVGIEVLSASSCIPLEGFQFEKLEIFNKRELCKKQIIFISSKLKEYDKIIFATVDQMDFESEFDPRKEMLLNFFKHIKENNKKLLVLTPPPYLKTNYLKLERLAYFGLKLNTEFVMNKQIDNLYKIWQEDNNIRFYNPSKEKLFLTVPFYNDKLIYSDNWHLNTIGSIEYGFYLTPVISKYFNLY